MSDLTITFVDQPSTTLSAQLDNQALAKAERFARQALQPVVDEVVRRRFMKRTVECSAPEAGEVLRDSIGLVTAEIQRWADGYSPIRWLWMLRRLPREVFEGTLSTTYGYDSVLAEVISGRSTQTRREARYPNAATLTYSLEGAVVTRLARFCEGVRFLSDLHRCYRWAGKGSGFRFEAGRRPQEIADSSLRSAVELYDKRVEASERPLSRMGTSVAMPELPERLDKLLGIYRISPIKVLVPAPGIHVADRKESGKLVKAEAKYLPALLSIDPFARLLGDKRVDPSLILTDESASLLYLLACSTTLLARHYSGFLSAVMTGYLMWNADRCFSILRGLFEEVPETVRHIVRAAGVRSADEVITRLASVSGSDWPLSAGPVFRHDGDAVCVDLAAAASRLDTSLEFPAIQGELANARAHHFEDEVQAIIDDSCWQPSSGLWGLRRRKIMRNGRQISDVDAIGEHEGTLLLVSCKSVVYSKSYDAGDYKAVRNAASLVRDAVLRWDAVMEELRQNRTGDNYDLSSLRSIVGVVCTPNVIFVDLDTAKRFAAPGLRSSSSAVELAEWLGVDVVSPWGRRLTGNEADGALDPI